MLTPFDVLNLSRKHDGIPEFFWRPGPAHMLVNSTRAGFERSVHLRAYSDVLDFERNEGNAFSRAALRAPGTPDHPLFYAPWFIDDPLHAEYRDAVKGFFQASRMPRWKPVIAEVTARRIETIQIRPGRRFDLVTELLQPVALEVIGRILGASGEQMRAFWSHLAAITEFEKMNRYPDPGTLNADLDAMIDRRVAGGAPGGAYEGLLEPYRRGCPVGGEEHGDDILRGFAAAALFAGTDTIAMTIANGFMCLQRMGRWEEAKAAATRGDTTELMQTFDELMRLFPAFPASAARTVEDTTLRSGYRIRAGELVVAWITSANRDPSGFADPLAFRRGRPEGHLTFGWYRHYCLGAPLARLELEVVVPMVLTAFPGLRPDPAAGRVRHAGRVNRLVADPYVYGPVN